MAEEQTVTEASRGTRQFADFVEKTDFFGNPRGLATLFFTEFWERFSYYGMRALLTLFMIAQVTSSNPGMGLSKAMAGSLYGIYTFFVYVMGLPGGWVADKLWGARRSVFVGGCIIALGHFTMASPLVGLPLGPTFFIGLFLITIGTGLLKPNVSAMVGGFYPEGGAKRDAGYSIYYMGINFGALLGPTLTSVVGEGINWHYGFSLAGIGMLIGLICYKLGDGYLGDIGLFESNESKAVLRRRSTIFYICSALVIGSVVAIGWLLGAGVINISLENLAYILGIGAVVITLAFFGYLTFFGGHTVPEKKKLGVILWLFILEALFWSGFEQAGSSLNIFAEQGTHRYFGPFNWIHVISPIIIAVITALILGYLCYRLFKNEKIWGVIKGVVVLACAGIVIGIYFLFSSLSQGWTMPASMLQNIQPFWIVVLAPVFGYLWVWLARRNANPSIPAKFGLGLLGLAVGFFVIFWGAAHSAGPHSASVGWLVGTYFLFTCGELSLSPVGLSSMTKLAPKGRVSQMMGIWFVGTALGDLFAGLMSAQLETSSASGLFFMVACIAGGGGIIALLVSPFVKKLMGDVR
jgi:POT family proton-dependent oligopeptide transporter